MSTNADNTLTKLGGTDREPPAGDSASAEDGDDSHEHHEHCFTLPVCVRPGAVPLTVDADGNAAYRRADLIPFARSLPEFEKWWPSLLKSTAPGSTQVLVLGGWFDLPDLSGDTDSGPAGGMNWSLIEDVQKEIRFGALPDGFFASLKGEPKPRGMRVELYRAH